MTAPVAAQVPFEPGVIVGGRYRVLSLIGLGGVGRVYLARHIELDTDVAIKVLRPEMNERPDAVQRFAREARASVRLRSERIARVLDVGTHEGTPYFVMEYLLGCNLLEARHQADVDITTLCEFFIQACEGLADAHAQGVVHRDVKPENLFVVRDASGWRSLKVFDFGISKFSLTGKFSDVDLAAMRTEFMMGTPHYISPEQIRSTRDVDHRTDLWSLGAVMFEVLSGGILPFREEREVTALVAEVLERPHRSLLDVAPNVPERLARIVDRCLVKDRELRYQTAAEVALDLLPLAPARARASVERAVSVMQAAGLMPLNGDLESLRASPAPHSDRLSGPEATSDARAPSGNEKPSLPLRGESDRASQALSSAPSLQDGAPISLAGATSVQPVVVPRALLIAEPVNAWDEPRRSPRGHRGALAGLLLAGAAFSVVFLLATRGQPPVADGKPVPVAAVRVESTPLASPSSPSAPNLVPAPATAEAPVAVDTRTPAASVERKSQPAKAASFPRPSTAKTSAPPASNAVSVSSPPPSRLELRRER